jgi:hypothetical protein
VHPAGFFLKERADLAVVIQATNEHSVHTSLTRQVSVPATIIRSLCRGETRGKQLRNSAVSIVPTERLLKARHLVAEKPEAEYQSSSRTQLRHQSS